jgi:hypothetical protein
LSGETRLLGESDRLLLMVGGRFGAFESAERGRGRAGSLNADARGGGGSTGFVEALKFNRGAGRTERDTTECGLASVEGAAVGVKVAVAFGFLVDSHLPSVKTSTSSSSSSSSPSISTLTILLPSPSTIVSLFSFTISRPLPFSILFSADRLTAIIGAGCSPESLPFLPIPSFI